MIWAVGIGFLLGVLMAKLVLVRRRRLLRRRVFRRAAEGLTLKEIRDELGPKAEPVLLRGVLVGQLRRQNPEVFEAGIPCEEQMRYVVVEKQGQ